MLGMSSEAISVIRQFVADQGVTFPIVHDQGGVVRGRYRLSNALSPYPRDYIIDQDGVLRYTATEYHPQTMVRVIESLLGVSVDVDSQEKPTEALPRDISLKQNYPNPFNASTVFTFELPKEDHITFSIYNLAGKRIAELLNQRMPAGRHSLTWDGSVGGKSAPSGLYFYQLAASNASRTKKLSLVR